MSNPTPFEAKPTSSPESQVRYMQTLLKAKQYEIDTLTNERDALILEQALERKRFKDTEWALEEALRRRPIPIKKKPWWRFWAR